MNIVTQEVLLHELHRAHSAIADHELAVYLDQELEISFPATAMGRYIFLHEGLTGPGYYFITQEV